ncbi:MAG: hypothetical protein K6B14_00020 [Lachnospiraceae bacterium]|nr:hypothetical protein [Lachnospiraceae bacterium]
MSEFFTTGLLKDKSKQQFDLRVDEKEKQEIERFLKNYMPENQEISYRTVRDAQRNFELLDHCRALQKDKKISSTADGTANQVLEPGELSWKEKQELEKKIKEARSHIPDADISVYYAAMALEKIKGERESYGLNDYNFGEQSEEFQQQIVNELLEINLDESMLTEDYIMSHVEQLAKYSQNLIAARNYFISEEGRASLYEMDELERGVISTRILSIAVPVQKHISNILLKNGISLKNMTYVNLKNVSEGTEGYKYKNTDHVAAATESFEELSHVLQAQKDAEAVLFEENLGATIHSMSKEQIAALEHTNPARYQLIKEYVEAEQREQARRQAAAANPDAIDRAAKAAQEQRTKEEILNRRLDFIKTGKTDAKNDDEHAAKWELADYADIIWEQYKDKYEINSEEDDNFFADIMTINDAVHDNLSYINTLVKSQEVRDSLTMGLPQLEEKLAEMLRSDKKSMLITDAEAFAQSARDRMSSYKSGEEGEFEKWTGRYNSLKEILPASCFEIPGGVNLIEKLVMEPQDAIFEKKKNALIHRKEEYRGILKAEVEKSVSPLSREKVMADIEKALDYRMVFSDRRGITAAIKGELKYLVFVSPDSVYMESDLKSLMDSYKLPMLDEYMNAISAALMKDEGWKKVAQGKDRVKAMKELLDKDPAFITELQDKEKKRLEQKTTETTEVQKKTEETSKPVTKPSKADEKARALEKQNKESRALALFTEDVEETDREIFYQYKKVEGKDRFLLQGKYDITERERRTRYARKVWEILEDNGTAAKCAANLAAFYDKSLKSKEQKEVRKLIKDAIKKVFEPGAVELPAYMEMGTISADDIIHEISLMGMDVELLSTGCAGADSFLEYETEKYQKGLAPLGEKYRARYIDLENTLVAEDMHLTKEEIKAYRKRLHKVMCTGSDDDWAYTMTGFEQYIKSLHDTTGKRKGLAEKAAAVHQRVTDRTKKLQSFDGGKLLPVIDRLKQDPEVWQQITQTEDDEAFDIYVERLNDTVGVLMDAAKKSNIPEFVLDQYLAEKYDTVLKSLIRWDKKTDKGKLSEGHLERHRAKKVDEYAKKLTEYLSNDFMKYKIEGRRSIEEHINNAWESNFGEVSEDSKMDPLTYVALLYSQKGASFKMLYKQGTLEKELETISARQKEYAKEIKAAFDEVEVPEELGMSKEAVEKMYSKYVFIHAKDLPKLKGAEKTKQPLRKDEADKLVANFYEYMEELHAKEQKQERKSAEALKKERKYLRRIRDRKIKGVEKSTDYFNMGLSAEEFDKLMKSRSVLLAGRSDAHLDNDTEELKDHDEELDKIVGKEGMDPFVYTCLLEKYQSLMHSDRADDGDDAIEKELLDDHQFLSRLKVFSDNEGYSKDKQECFIAWFYRHGEQYTLFLGHETNTDADFKDNERFLEKQKLFEQGYSAILDLEKLQVEDPVVKREHAIYAARMRMEFFAMEPIEMERFSETLRRKKDFLFLEDVMVPLYKEVLEKNEEVNAGEGTDYGRYLTGLKEYFVSDLIQVVQENEKSKSDPNPEAFDVDKFKEKFRKKIEGLVNDRAQRQYLYNTTNSVTYDDAYGEQKAIEGQKTSRDLDALIRGEKCPWDKEEYDKLSVQEKKLFALALTIASEGGSSLYEGTSALLKNREEKEKLQEAVTTAAKCYLGGENIEGFIDYDMALRKLVKDKTGTSGKLEYNKDVFDEAMTFTQLMIERRQKNIEEKEVDKSLLDDSKTSIYAANQVAGKPQLKELDKQELRTPQGLFEALKKEAQSSKDKDVQKIMKRVEDLVAEDGFWKLIQVLQNRTALDFSTGQLEAEDAHRKVIGHVDEAKRKAVKELFMDDLDLDTMRKRAERPNHMKRALMSLLSFQLRDNVDFSGREITEEDFDKHSLSRETTFDWELIEHGLDFLNEITNEQNQRKINQRQFINVVGNAEQIKGLESVEDYAKKHEKKEYDTMIFEAQLMAFAEKDFPEGSEGDDHAAIMAGYFALSKEEKALFFRALEHRDVLDISKVNLYWNLIGRGERDYVNPEGRNALIDEFIDSTGGAAHMTMKEDTIYNAMTSLLSTQFDDSMDYADPKLDIKKYMAGERMYLFQRKTAIDWKLFARALQMVHRAKTEMDMTKGARELQRGLGDISSAGRMSMDVSYMRTNIHNTGSRLTRFVAKEAGDRVVEKLPVDKLQDVAAYILSVDSMNKINGVLSRLNIEAEEEEDEEEEEEEQQDEEQQDEEEDEERSFLKEMTSLFFTVKDAVKDVKEELEPLKEPEEIEKTPLQKILEGEGIDLPEKEDITKELIDGIRDVFEKIGDYDEKKGDLDNNVLNAENQQMVSKLLGEKITGFVLGFYTKLSNYYDDKKDTLETGLDNLVGDLDSLMSWIPKQKEIMDLGKKFTDFWEDNGDTVTGYISDGVKCGVAIKNIYAATKNMKELDDASVQALLDRKKDDENISTNIRTQSAQQWEVFQRARKTNQGLTDLSSRFAKDREKEDIILNSGDIAGTAVRIAGDVLGNEVAGKALEEVVKEAAKLIKFIHHCIADHKGMEEYYNGAGSYQAMPMRKNISRLSGLKGRVVAMSNAKLVQTARGFETEEELVTFTGFQMVHALMFSATNYNPLKETRNVSKVVLGVLGLQDVIGKTDAESAMRVYERLTR